MPSFGLHLAVECRVCPKRVTGSDPSVGIKPGEGKQKWVGKKEAERWASLVGEVQSYWSALPSCCRLM